MATDFGRSDLPGIKTVNFPCGLDGKPEGQISNLKLSYVDSPYVAVSYRYGLICD